MTREKLEEYLSEVLNVKYYNEEELQKIYDAVKKELEAQNKQLDIHWCDTFDQSLETAKRIAKPGQVVLFSPASTSFDMFKDMYDRGDQFRDKVNLMC